MRGGVPSDNPQDTSSGSQGSETTAPEEEDPYVWDDLPADDFGGKDFNILTTTWYTAAKYIYSDTQNGDVMNDAIYTTITTVEERFNVNINVTSETDPQTNVLNPKAGFNRANPKAFAWRSGEDFSYTEAKTWCAALLMSGSDIFLGDALAKLNDRGLELVRKTVAAADFVAAVPVLDGERIPAVWRKENWLYVFNFTKQERQFCLEAKGTWRDLFDGAVYGEEAGQLRLTVPAHGAACLEAI